MHTYGSWDQFFFSAAPTAQNSPELHFRFINFFIQPSRVGSLEPPYPLRVKVEIKGERYGFGFSLSLMNNFWSFLQIPQCSIILINSHLLFCRSFQDFSCLHPMREFMI